MESKVLDFHSNTLTQKIQKHRFTSLSQRLSQEIPGPEPPAVQKHAGISLSTEIPRRDHAAKQGLAESSQ